MFAWATEQLDKLSQTVAPPPTDAPGRYQYAVQRLDEETAMGCVAEFEPLYTVVNVTKGSYPVHLACQYSLVRLIRLLMNQPGASVEQVDKNGDTPLHYACMSTQPNALDVVKMLLMDYGADVCAKNAQGKYPYDVATLNSIRQHLLPIQLQKETQACLDNGGQGLPPGIDLGGLKIQNPAIPPPPTFAGGAGALGPPSFSMSAAGTSPYAPPPMPNMTAASSTTNFPPAPQTFPSTAFASAPAASTPSIPAPRSYGSRSISASKKSDDLATDPTTGYSRTGGSSLAVYSKYKADGFHSSSSDVNLQRKYGHVGGGGPGAVPPPPSSGNSLTTPPPSGGVPATPFMTGGINPFSRSSSGLSSVSTGGSRYVSYGPAATPAATTYGQIMTTPSNPSVPIPQYFTPVVSSPAAGSATSLSSPAATATTTSTTPTQGMTEGSTTTDNIETTKTAAALFQTPHPVQHQTSQTGPHEPDNNISTSKNDNTIGDWVEATDPTTGKTYYYNPTTNETSWEKPESEKQADSVVSTDEDDEWQEILDPSIGKPYYFNAKTNETRWEKPETMEDEQDDSDDASEGAGSDDDEEPELEPSDDGGATISEGSSAVETGALGDLLDETNEDDEGSSVESVHDSVEEEEPSADEDQDDANENISVDDALPDGWVEVEDPSSGRNYYYNSLTQETSWERPLGDGGTSHLEPVVVDDGDDEDDDAGEEVHPTTATDEFGDGWTQVTDPNTGSIYYYNQLTQETSWEKPSAGKSNDSTGGWSEVVDPISGKTYYHNATTNETSWTCPAELAISSVTEAVSPGNDSPPERTTSANMDVNSTDHPESTADATKLDTFSVPIETRNADDLFSSGPPGGESSRANNPFSTEPATTPAPTIDQRSSRSSPDEQAKATAASLFSAPSSEEVQECTDGPSTVANDELEDKQQVTNQEEGEIMEEVPLTPDIVTKTVSPDVSSNDPKTEPSSSRAVASQPQNDLFAAIGLPPPPVRSKR